MISKLLPVLIMGSLSSISFVCNGSESSDKVLKSEIVYINGVRHNLSHQSFVKTGKKYTATVRVDGDNGQPLIFDIDAKVKGIGFYDVGFDCSVLYYQPDGSALIGGGFPPNCQFTSVNPGNEFFFSIRMNVTCNGIPIGTNTENRNSLLSSQQVAAIKDSVNDTWGFVIGNPYEKKRNLNLLVDSNRITGGKCKELKLELEGFQGTQITEISSDITIAESF